MSKKAPEAEAPEAKAPEATKVTGGMVVRATNGSVLINSKLTVTGKPVTLEAGYTKDAKFMRHVEYGIQCGILEVVK